VSWRQGVFDSPRFLGDVAETWTTSEGEVVVLDTEGYRKEYPSGDPLTVGSYGYPYSARCKKCGKHAGRHTTKGGVGCSFEPIVIYKPCVCDGMGCMVCGATFDDRNSKEPCANCGKSWGEHHNWAPSEGEPDCYIPAGALVKKGYWPTNCGYCSGAFWRKGDRWLNADLTDHFDEDGNCKRRKS